MTKNFKRAVAITVAAAVLIVTVGVTNRALADQTEADAIYEVWVEWLEEEDRQANEQYLEQLGGLYLDSNYVFCREYIDTIFVILATYDAAHDLDHAYVGYTVWQMLLDVFLNRAAVACRHDSIPVLPLSGFVESQASPAPSPSTP